MRTAFLNALLQAAECDPTVWLVVGDLGYSVVEPFRDRFPERFLNAGVAEQNMIGVAAGIARSGNVVFVYSIGNFPTLRCLEQIRNDVCYHRANVKIVSVGGGLAYGAAGSSHHATEDLAIMRALPEMQVVAPGDPAEAASLTQALAVEPGPAYLRLGKAGEPAVHAAPPPLRLGKALLVRDGSDVTLVSTGGMLASIVQAADLLTEDRISTRVLSLHTLRPFDVDAIRQSARETRALVSVEEHGDSGGLGAAVAQVLAADHGRRVVYREMSLGNTFQRVIGSQEYLRQRAGLAPGDIARVARDALLQAL